MASIVTQGRCEDCRKYFERPFVGSTSMEICTGCEQKRKMPKPSKWKNTWLFFRKWHRRFNWFFLPPNTKRVLTHIGMDPASLEEFKRKKEVKPND